MPNSSRDWNRVPAGGGAAALERGTRERRDGGVKKVLLRLREWTGEIANVVARPFTEDPARPMWASIGGGPGRRVAAATPDRRNARGLSFGRGSRETGDDLTVGRARNPMDHVRHSDSAILLCATPGGRYNMSPP